MAKELGCYGEMKVWHRIPKLSLGKGLKMLSIDKDAMEIGNHITAEKEVEIYIEGVIVGSYYVRIDDPKQGLNSKTKGKDKTEVEDDEQDEGVNGEIFYDSEYEEHEEEQLFETNINLEVESLNGEAVEIMVSEKDIAKGKGKGKENIKGKGKDKVVVTESEDDIDEEWYHSKDIPEKILPDDDENDPDYPEFYAKADMTDPQFVLGIKFTDRTVFVEAMKVYSIKLGKGVIFLKNEKERVREKCRSEKCPWMIFASKMQLEHILQVKTILNKHKCGRKYNNVHVRSDWLAKRFLKTFKSNPNISAVAFQNKVHRKIVVEISRCHAYRAKKKALQIINGTVMEQFSKLYDYRQYLLKLNPNSTIEIELKEGTMTLGKPVFQMMYFCFGALKEGFKHCRPIVCLDGCHLSGPTKGMLLTAISIDANNMMYHLAYTVVEGENGKSWSWFLDYLRVDLNMGDGAGFLLLSDKQKGLIYSIKQLLPEV